MQDQTARLMVWVTPRSSRNRITAFIDGTFWISVAAPPNEGRANEELLSFLARSLGISKTSVSIKRGEASRTKQIAVFGLTEEEAWERLSKRLSCPPCGLRARRASRRACLKPGQ